MSLSNPANENNMKDISLNHEEEVSPSPTNKIDTTTEERSNKDVSSVSKDTENKITDDDDNDDDVQALLSELEAEKTQDEIALEKLRISTMKLTHTMKKVSSDIDSKLGFSNSLKAVDSTLQVANSVKAIDSQFGVGQSVSNASGSIGNWISNLNMQAKANSVLEQAGMKEAFDTDVQRLKNFNKEHEITASAVGGIASGFDWIATSILPSSKEEIDK